MSPCECVPADVRTSHVAHVNASCHTHECIHVTHEWVVSHTGMSQGTHTNGSRHTYEWTFATRGGVWTIRLKWVVSHIMNGSCHTYKWVMLHIRHELSQGPAWRGEVHWNPAGMMSCVTRYVTHMNATCHTYEWVMSHIWRDLRNKERIIELIQQFVLGNGCWQLGPCCYHTVTSYDVYI